MHMHATAKHELGLPQGAVKRDTAKVGLRIVV
jgi:hypothetical protein